MALERQAGGVPAARGLLAARQERTGAVASPARVMLPAAARALWPGRAREVIRVPGTIPPPAVIRATAAREQAPGLAVPARAAASAVQVIIWGTAVAPAVRAAVAALVLEAVAWKVSMPPTLSAARDRPARYTAFPGPERRARRSTCPAHRWCGALYGPTGKSTRPTQPRRGNL